MKKLINNVDDVVIEALHGMEQAHPDLLKVHYNPNFLTRADAPVKDKVAVISGGGSGHEPLHGGFVGKGMLDAACPGEIFTSPTPDQMEEATKAVSGGKGVLHIVKNYSGDVMNFEMAADIVQGEGIEVASVVIDDDVAVKDSLYTEGRRGVGSTVFAEKLCGAAAEKGMTLEEVTNIAKFVKENGRSMGMALTSCIVPAAGNPTFDLGAEEIEIGIGIHGEPGRERMKMKTATELVEMMGEAVVSDIPFKSGDELIVMVNGMGGTPLIELYLLYNQVAAFAKAKGLKIVRNLVGNYITSLEMQGFSLTMMRVNKEIVELWDAPVFTPALKWG
ncbi:MAG: phosphoenolpyruvate---glycerone phosphotransferase subunit DhaK [Verrucomicrobiota bacterium]|jgi:dihydroxyacetone kinase-like protein|nr:phosphoenolpyruvate---glycerone phosphotransferase subunit DhaK [Verrucomicrobiota bacterium]MDK2964319.1 phosphoenolpyruvate---glycerone phosphotransferase subunit DhaK [Verrucomicrobiota bacterium]